MAITTSSADNVVRIIVGDRFSFDSHNEFRAAYKDAPKGSGFIIDMGQTSYMDSSALGMMLLLREHAGADDAKISIVGCSPEIKNILTISKFDKLFNIS